MQRTTKFGILFLAVALTVALGRLALKTHRPEPSYLGKPVSFWVIDGFTWSPGKGRPPAESAFRSMGSNAVPFVIATLAKTDGPFQQIYLRCYPKLPAKLRAQLPHPTPADAIRNRAILALALLGPSAKAAIPALLNVLTNDPASMHRANAVHSLDAIDNGDFQHEVIDALKRAETDADPWVARTATQTLKRRLPLGFLPLTDREMSMFREGAHPPEKIGKK